MATPRQRYPSDEARLKTKPHVKVHLRARTHRKTAAAFAKPETRGVIVGLWMLAGDAYANKTGDRVILTRTDCSWLAGREQFTVALRTLRAACAQVGYSVDETGPLITVHVRNFAKKQGLDSARRGVPRGGSAERTPPQNQTQNQNAEADKKSARPPASQPTVPPEVVEAVEQAFEAYGKRPRSWGSTRIRAMRARAAESGGFDALAQAVHGYAWKNRHASGDFDAAAYHTPDTVFRASKFPGYLDAYGEAIASGAKPPFHPQQSLRLNGRGETVAEAMARMDREEAAREARGDA